MVAGVAASTLALALCARIEWPWPALELIALVPWLAVLDRSTSLRQALAAGVLMCVAFVVAVFWWFASAIQSYTAGPWPAAPLLLVLVAPLVEPQFVVFALVRHLVRGAAPGSARGVAGVVAAACAYVGSEWASGKLFADTLGHGLYPSLWMRQAADLAGAHGLTLVVLLVNECACAALRAGTEARARRSLIRRVLAPATCAALLVGGLVAYGAWRCRELAATPGEDAPITVGLVQADISQYDRLAAEVGTFAAVRRILETHFQLSDHALRRGGLDLLVWPETVYPTTFGSPKSADGEAFDRAIGAYVDGIGIPLVFGAYDTQGGDEFNAAVFLEPTRDGRLEFETYHKALLFPLTERVPAMLESELVRRVLPWLGTWQPGAGPQVRTLALRDGRMLPIAPLICYDAIDPSFALAAVRRGAEVIVTLSNDSWFAVGAGPRLHLVVSAFRSIESRRPQVRVTNTGISAVVSPTGALESTAGVHERTVLVGTVTPQRRWTLMIAWGDWFGPCCLVVALLLLAVRAADRLRRGAESRAA